MKHLINDFTEVEQVLTDLGKCEAGIAEQEAKMNQEIMEIQDKYAGETSKEREKAQMLRTTIEDFCRSNIEEFEDPRSKEYVSGKIGFRKNPPKVLQLNKKTKVEATLELIKKLWRKTRDMYIRTKEELDKDMILSSYVEKKKAAQMTAADLKDKLTDEKLAAVGLRVEQDETFTLEINWDSLK